MSSISILDLPVQVLERILDNVGESKDLSLVCRDFYRAICKNHEKDVVVTFEDHDLVS
jgi:hypothetical protein